MQVHVGWNHNMLDVQLNVVSQARHPHSTHHFWILREWGLLIRRVFSVRATAATSTSTPTTACSKENRCARCQRRMGCRWRHRSGCSIGICSPSRRSIQRRRDDRCVLETRQTSAHARNACDFASMKCFQHSTMFYKSRSFDCNIDRKRGAIRF